MNIRLLHAIQEWRMSGRQQASGTLSIVLKSCWNWW